jgi:hypothetical protein
MQDAAILDIVISEVVEGNVKKNIEIFLSKERLCSAVTVPTSAWNVCPIYTYLLIELFCIIQIYFAGLNMYQSFDIQSPSVYAHKEE